MIIHDFLSFISERRLTLSDELMILTLERHELRNIKDTKPCLHTVIKIYEEIQSQCVLIYSDRLIFSEGHQRKFKCNMNY